MKSRKPGSEPSPYLKDVREKAQRYYLSYKQHSTAVALMWGIFTCGYVVLNVIVFIQPQWIGRFERSSSSLTVPGYVGLYERCRLTNHGFDLTCNGKFNNWSTVNHPAFRAATFFVGVSCLIIWICIALFVLFFILKPFIVFTVCGILQFVSALFMFLGCIIFPAGWNDPDVITICGSKSDRYVLADCKVGWAYILAIVGFFDALFLAILAFVLAARQTNFLEDIFSNISDETKLDGLDEESSKPSVIVTPAAKYLEKDRFSEFSHSSKRSRKSNFAL